MQIRCPKCEKPLVVPDELMGKSVRCRHCSQVLKVAASRQSKPAQATPNPPTLPQPVAPTKPTPAAPQPAAPAPAPSAAPAQPSPIHATGPTWRVKVADGAEYGPVTQHDLESWVAERRLDSESQVLRQDWNQWQWADDIFPQLKPAAQAPAAVPSAPQPTAPAPRAPAAPAPGPLPSPAPAPVPVSPAAAGAAAVPSKGLASLAALTSDSKRGRGKPVSIGAQPQATAPAANPYSSPKAAASSVAEGPGGDSEATLQMLAQQWRRTRTFVIFVNVFGWIMPALSAMGALFMMTISILTGLMGLVSAAISAIPAYIVYRYVQAIGDFLKRPSQATAAQAMVAERHIWLLATILICLWVAIALGVMLLGLLGVGLFAASPPTSFPSGGGMPSGGGFP